MDSIKKKMHSLATETANAQVRWKTDWHDNDDDDDDDDGDDGDDVKVQLAVQCSDYWIMVMMMVMVTMTSLQARCERWEKEAASTNATADHLEDQVSMVMMVVVADDHWSRWLRS